MSDRARLSLLMTPHLMSDLSTLRPLGWDVYIVFVKSILLLKLSFW